MSSRSEKVDASRLNLKEYLNKEIDFDKICLLCGKEVSDSHQLKCCNRIFDYNCLIKYLQFEESYPSATCPYCRQTLKSLPLKKGQKALKHVHEEFYQKKNKKTSKKNFRFCQGFKKNLSPCIFKAIEGSLYCKHHQNQDSTTCQGKKKDGTKCSFKVSKGKKYCQKHQPKEIIQPKCQGKYLSGIKKGQHCLHNAIEGGLYCYYHRFNKHLNIPLQSSIQNN